MKTLNKENQHEININIDSLPEWANYIAMDEDGDWYVYDTKPVIDDTFNGWDVKEFSNEIVKLSISHKEKNWKESLYKIERMENKQKKHKWYKEIISFAEGEVIEVKHKEGDTWTTAITPQFNDERYVFRVKSEPKYIPFTFEDREVFRGKWVRRKKDTAEFIIHNISRNYVNGYSYEEALEKWEFIDGTPFGKLEVGVK